MTAPQPRRRTPTWFAAVRDPVLLAAGLGVLGHETVVVAEPRPILLMIAALMLGLPATMAVDRLFVRSHAAPPDPADPPEPAAELPAGSSGSSTTPSEEAGPERPP